jgi:predicted outer membrane repeat protein
LEVKILENKTYKPLVIILFLTVAILSFASIDNSSAASILYVNGSSGNDSYDGESPIFTSGINGPKSTIQNATNTIDLDGTINVANGIYKEHLIINKSVNLIGESQIGTIIDGEHTGRVITINGNPNVYLAKFTIQNGDGGYGLGYSSSGGGIYNQGNLTIYNTTIQNNYGPYTEGIYEGGAIYNKGSLTIYNSNLQNNQAEGGGGICNAGLATIINTTIQNNTAGEGGAIENYGTAIIKNSKIQNNDACEYYGGGICNGGKITIINTIIQNNKAKYGGAIYNYGTANIINTIIQKNVAYYGGAIYNYRKLTTTGSKIQNNKAKYGGAIYNKGTKSTISLKKSTIRNNTATKYGGAIYSTSGKIVANYNRITGNTHYAIYRKGGTINAKYNWWGSKKPEFYKIIKGKVAYRPWLKK